MTTKETSEELEEILNYKQALSNKITHNLFEVEKILSAFENSDDKDEKRQLKVEARRGKQIISVQVTERSKLTMIRIARELNIKLDHVKYRERQRAGVRL